MNWRRLCGPTHQRVIDEYEVGTRAAKVWGWTDHYVPPGQYVRIRAEQNARAVSSDLMRSTGGNPTP